MGGRGLSWRDGLRSWGTAEPLGKNGAVAGAVLIALVLVVVLPAVWWAIWGLMAWALGQLLTEQAEAAHPGSELIATNV